MVNWILEKLFRLVTLGQETRMRFDLRCGERTLGALTVEPGRKPLLEHDLSFEQLRMRPQVKAFDEAGVPLEVVAAVDGSKVNAVLRDASGSERVAIGEDDFGFLDVDDSKKLAGLRTFPSGRGSIGNEPIAAGKLVFELGPFESVRIFGGRVLDLYHQVDDWIAGTLLKTERREYSLTEELYGSYKIPKLELKRHDGTHVAALVPIGAAVIAAEGRVELVGTRDRQPLVYFAAGGPQISVTSRGGPTPVQTSRRVFRDVASDGWYWLEDVRLGRARLLDCVLFKDLIRTVSDLYEL